MTVGFLVDTVCRPSEPPGYQPTCNCRGTHLWNLAQAWFMWKKCKRAKDLPEIRGDQKCVFSIQVLRVAEMFGIGIAFPIGAPRIPGDISPDTYWAVFTSTILINEPLQHMFCIVLSVLIHGYMIAYMSLFILGSGWRFYHLHCYPWSFIWIKNDKGTASKMIRKTWSTAGARRSGLGGGTFILM